MAAVAALLLSVAMIASAPRSSLTSLAGARIVFLGTADAAHAAATEHPTTSGHAPACQAPAGNASHAALAARRAVLVRHTSLPPPAAT